jgi:hypothetical protein
MAQHKDWKERGENKHVRKAMSDSDAEKVTLLKYED